MKYENEDDWDVYSHSFSYIKHILKLFKHGNKGENEWDTHSHSSCTSNMSKEFKVLHKKKKKKLRNFVILFARISIFEISI